MQKIVLTNEGFNLLNTNHSEGQSQYWIGYYGLAYVPEGSALSANMTTLTPDGGDNIYNVFQGSMTTAKAGIDTDISDTAAYNLANECMYSANVMSRFRYVLDDNDNNQLVIFADNRDLATAGAKNLAAGLVEYAILRNEDEEHVTVVGENDTGYGITKVDTLPLPAPLYYGGEPKNYSALDATLADTVTHDTRSYSSSNHALAQGYDVGTPGINGEAPTSADKFDYVASRGNTFSDDVTNVDDAILDKSWQLQSVSNFNRFHAPTNAEGYSQDYEPACRNMAKVTKLFPIDHYDVICTTESNTNKVATVKYTVKVDLINSLNAISNRSTPYYRMQNGTLSEVSASNYKAGFKFNRIGIYAVQTSLHAYNTEEDAKVNCHHLQMQVIGDSEPVLVAVMDLPTPIVLSEDGICEYSFDFQINFVKPESQCIDDAAIYYNLYEDDAITWYKNQLIANASTAEAVTSLGVQMAYLRQQINQYTGAGTSSCGIVDEDNRYALEGHTHPYMKNIVDSNAMGNGATRGVDTQAEDTPIKIYQTKGQRIEEDEQGIPHYAGKPESVVPLLIDTTDAMTGDESINLGKDSATLGALSINMSNYGILGTSTASTLLMGGRGKSDRDKYSDDHLAVKSSSNSFINVVDGEFTNIRGSIWVASDSDVWVNGSVQHSIGIGHNDVIVTESDVDPIEPQHGSALSSLLLGRNAVYTNTLQSIVCGEGERGSMQAIGEYDVMSDIDAYWMDSNHIDESLISTSRNGYVNSLLSVGTRNRISRNLRNVMSTGDCSKVLSQSTNSLIIGSQINNAPAAHKPDYRMVMTVDEFNERYGQLGDYPDDDPLYLLPRDTYNKSQVGQIVVLGSGELNFNQDGRVYTRDVRGVTLYITYDFTNKSWDPGYTVGASTETSGNVFDKRSYQYADLYTTGGHTKNMLMLGDYINTGFGSENSILIGDYTGSRKIVAKNSFMNFLGDTRAFETSNTVAPSMTFDNVWWIGATNTGPSGDNAGNIDTNVVVHIAKNYASEDNWSGYNGHYEHLLYNRTNFERAVYKDAFVFRGDNKNVYDHGYWYGCNNSIAEFAYTENTEGYTFKPDDFFQPVHSPMIYTGGLALGGYGTNDTNFMLLKIGTSATSNNGHMGAYTSIWGRNGSERLIHSGCIATSGGFSGIRRQSNVWGPWDGTQEFDEYFDVSIEPGTNYTWEVPASIWNRYDYKGIKNMYAVYGTDEYRMSFSSEGVTADGRPYYVYRLGTHVPSAATKIRVVYEAGNYKTSYFIYDCYDDVTVEYSYGSGINNLDIPDGYVLVSTVDEIKETIEIVDDATHEKYPADSITISLYNDNTRIHIKVDPFTSGHTATARVKYKAYSTNNSLIYNYHNDTLGIDHFMTDSPYAGMVLMVQDKQELDGTLHVGLGAIPDSTRDVFGCNYTVRLKCSYISNSHTFGFETAFHGYSSSDFGVDTHLNNDKLNTSIIRTATYNGFTFNVTMKFTQQDNQGEQPTGSNPIVCNILNAGLYIPLNGGYFVDLYVGSLSGTGFNIDSGYLGNLYAKGGELASKPTYLRLGDTASSMFTNFNYMKIYLYSQGDNSVFGITSSGKQVTEMNGKLFKLTTLDFARNKTPLTGSFDGNTTYPIYLEEVYVDTNDGHLYETTSAVRT